LLALHRVAFRSALQVIRRRGWNLRHVAVIGVGRLGRIVCRTLDRNSWTGIHVAYFLSHQDHNHGPEQCVSRPVLGGLADLESGLNGRGGAVKRALDCFGAMAAWLVFAPLMLLTAGVVRLTGPGPVIFQQRRVSLGGETFNIYKFRTMYHAEDEQAPAEFTQR